MVLSRVLILLNLVSQMSRQYYKPYLLYGQATEDGCSLTLCTCPAGSLPLLHPTHRNMLAHCRRWWLFWFFVRTAHMLFLLRETSAFIWWLTRGAVSDVSHGTSEPTLMSLLPANEASSPLKHRRLLPWSTRRLQHTCHSGTFLFQMWDPLSHKPLMSLSLLGLSWGWATMRLVGLQAATHTCLAPNWLLWFCTQGL